MTAYRFVTLTCDECGEIADDSARLVRQARAIASRSGWTYSGGKDICPRHHGYQYSEVLGWYTMADVTQ